jgi:BMFP domain-containing protein YqiC
LRATRRRATFGAMTTPPSSVFDDIAKLMTGAMGVAQGVGDEAKSFVRSQADRFVAEMDLVSREEFEVARQMAADARAEAEALRARIEALEAALAKKD